jgi:hypothetical protein
MRSTIRTLLPSNRSFDTDARRRSTPTLDRMDTPAPHIAAWLQRKLEREPFRPSRLLRASAVWERSTCRPLFGHVSLRVEPSHEFSFIDEAVWPDGWDEHSACVRDGILDALLIDLGCAPGGKFILERVDWRGDSSVPAAYRAAARQAVCELFVKNQEHGEQANAV